MGTGIFLVETYDYDSGLTVWRAVKGHPGLDIIRCANTVIKIDSPEISSVDILKNRYGKFGEIKLEDRW